MQSSGKSDNEQIEDIVTDAYNYTGAIYWISIMLKGFIWCIAENSSKILNVRNHVERQIGIYFLVMQHFHSIFTEETNIHHQIIIIRGREMKDS